MEFGQQLKAIRKEKGMTQVQLAKFLDVSEASICNWEKGNFTPNRFGIEVITEKLGIDCSHLARGKNNFYHLKARLKQIPAKSVLKIYESKQIEDLVDGLKWAILTRNTENEMLHIGLITVQLMQHCFHRNFEFEACLAKAMEHLESRGEEEKRWIELNNSRNRFKS